MQSFLHVTHRRIVGDPPSRGGRVDYQLDDIPRLQLFKRLRRRLIHIRQAMKTMSIDNIEIKLKYKRDGNLLDERFFSTRSSLNISLDQ